MVSTLILRSQARGVRPDFEVGSERVRDALQTPPESSVWRGRQVNETPIDRVELVWESANEGQKRLLERIWKDAGGPFRAMAYTPLGDIDANAVDVTFVDDTLEIERLSAKAWRMRCQVERAL